MQIRQLQVANDSIQDRLVLRVATDTNDEIRIYFTRRFLREVWPHLTGMLARQITTQPIQSAGDNVGNATPPTFEQPFRDENPSYPLGATPLLASEVTFENPGDGISRLILREARERSFTLNLNGELLQAFCSMLRAAAEQAKWDLTLNYDTPASLPGATGKSMLH